MYLIFMQITEDKVNPYEVLGCTPETVTDDDIETLKIYEKEKQYPPRFQLLFSPVDSQSDSTEAEVKINLHGLDDEYFKPVRLCKKKTGISCVRVYISSIN